MSYLKPVLAARQVSKTFGGVQALREVSLELYASEIHGLVGANGAGKSTLVKILAGVESPDSGEILIDGEVTRIRDPLRATSLGFYFIHQELTLIPKFSARQNMVLGLRKPSRLGILDWKQVNRRIKPVADQLGFAFSLDDPVENLSVADRWLVSIGRALVNDARTLVMDEPTASLSSAEVDRLFRIVQGLKSKGVAVLYVSHRLGEIESLCDRATVLKDGKLAAVLSRGDITRQALVRLIVGGDVAKLTVPPDPSHTSRKVASDDGQPIFEVRHLQSPPQVQDVSFRLYPGEVLGLAGLVGSGRTETARIIFGAERAASGEMSLNGRAYNPKSTRDAVEKGVVLVPEERRSQGLILKKSLMFNVALPNLRIMRSGSLLPMLSMARMAKKADQVIAALAIRPPRRNTEVERLSGGNQQKVVMGKWLVRDAQVLILDEPTRGVDVGARSEIHRLIREQAERGRAVLMIASELDELAGCDRVLVMDRGRVVGELSAGHVSEAAILRLAYTAEPTSALHEATD